MTNGHALSSEQYEDLSLSSLTEYDTEIIRRDLTFLRVVIDSVSIEDVDEWITEIVHSGAIYGFVMEYQIPTFEPSCKVLKDRFKANAKSYNTEAIKFHHKRVFKLDPNKKLWALWKVHCARFWLYVQLNVPGKFTKKQLAYCEVPLFQLLYTPFGLFRKFVILGKGFTGSVLLRIELGSHVKSLMERLDFIRNNVSDVFRRQRSRKAPAMQLSNVDNDDRTRRSNMSPTASLRRSLSPEVNEQFGSKSSILRSSSSLPTSLSSPSLQAHVQPSQSENYDVTLTVYAARRLPITSDSWQTSPPSTYVSVIANNGHILRSQLCQNSYEPEFNWSETFQVSNKRRNLVVKLWQKCMHVDKVLGFISIPLPPTYTDKTEYEMSNLMETAETPFITISLKVLRKNESSNDDESNETPILIASPKNIANESPSLKLSRQELSEKLQKNLNELQMLLEELRS